MTCSVRVRLLIVSVAGLVGTASVAGCGGNYSSPQATFETAKTAATSENWKAFFDCATPNSLDQIAGSMVFSASMMKGLGGLSGLGDPDKANKINAAMEKMDAVLEKHGVTEDAMKQAVDSAKPKPGQFSMPDFGSLSSMVTNKSQFIADMIVAMRSIEDLPDDDPFSGKFEDAVLTNVKIDGESATGTIESGGKENPVTFKNISGEWKIDLMPLGGAGTTP